jgi:beta-lactamase regulating signal transducer with metallopeptidase domain
MNAGHAFAWMILLQVTAITACAAVALGIARRQAALRHAMGVLALGFVLASPAFSLLLPRPAWLAPIAQNNASAPAVAKTASREKLSLTKLVDAGIVDGLDARKLMTDPSSVPLANVPDDSVNQHATVDPIDAPNHPARSTADERLAWLHRGFLLAVCIWVGGVVILCLRYIGTQRHLRSLTASVQPAFVDAIVVERACRTAELASPPLLGISDVAPMPLVLGCWRPVVLLPRHLAETASTSRLRDVLVHEFAHIARRDPWVNLAQQIARVVFWPHPGVLWLNQQIICAREEICDNFVLQGANSADYAQTLLDLAERCGGARFAVSLLGMFSRRWSLEKRIADLLNPSRISSTRADHRPLVAMTLSLLAICMLIGGVRAVGQDSDAANDTVAPVTSSQNEQRDEKKTIITVHGNCRDQNSKPVSQLWVRVYWYASGSGQRELLGETRAADGGLFSIPDVKISAAAAANQEKARLHIVATAKGYASAVKVVDEAAASEEVSLEMSNEPGTLSGVVTDEHGRPVAGATVYIPCCGNEPITDCKTTITDEQGRYAINDLRQWKPEDSKTFDAKTGITTSTQCFFKLIHPDYALTSAKYSAVPQQVDISLSPPAIIEGQVIDEVTGKTLPGVMISAQGIGRQGWLQTRTDPMGHYRLRTNNDHFNIWAEADDRIAIAAKAVAAESGQVHKHVDIRMVRGGFVVGTVIDGATDKPIESATDEAIHVAHYGPARPRTGAAVTSTALNPDGTYRLRVAPGQNYVYLMSGGTSAIVQVADGEETRLDLRTGEHEIEPNLLDDPDLRLRQRLLREAREAERAPARQGIYAAALTEPPKRQRTDTATGRLIDKLEEQNAGLERYHDPWLLTLKAIIDLGPAAVPALIAELDATADGMMLRCCGFMLRAINDTRAVPALIRSIPKTLLPPGSDMGLRSEDSELAKWAQQHELNPGRSRGNGYYFGRPVREIFGALRKLTGQTMSEQELNHMFLDGVASQRRLKRELFYREAKKWADWWDLHAAEFTQDAEYARVNLPPAVAEAVTPPEGEVHYKTAGGASNWVLKSVFDPQANQVFYDLDTGRVAGLPEKWREAVAIEPLLDEIADWATREGFDLMGTEYVAPGGKRYYALRGLALKAWELDSKRWKMTSDDITFAELQTEGAATDGLLLHHNKKTQSIDPETTASFLYMTREGTPGLLFVGIEVKDDSLKPGGIARGDNELNPVAFNKGRRFAFTEFEEK